MESIFVILMFGVVGLILNAPLVGAFDILSKVGRPTLRYHLIFNVVFFTWSVYDILFTEHYRHGLNTAFIIFPGFMAFLFFYALILPRLNRHLANETFRIRAIAVSINGVALFGLLLKS